MDFQAETILKEYGLAHDRALDWFFLSWNEKDPLEKELCQLYYKKYSKQANKLARKMAKLTRELYG